jgi:hypothetical protein
MSVGTVHHVSRQEGPVYQDSISIGTPGRGGEMKIYVNLDDPDASECRIREAFRLREIARDLQERQRVPA